MIGIQHELITYQASYSDMVMLDYVAIK